MHSPLLAFSLTQVSQAASSFMLCVPSTMSSTNANYECNGKAEMQQVG
jgi:hypothetical protein